MVVCGTYPKPESIEVPEHTPSNIASFYTQAKDALRRNQYDAAGAMCRKTLESATKKLDQSLKGDLNGRIDKLADAHLITPALKQWAHAIRLDGNEATHDEQPFAEEDAKQIASFTELFLLYVFTLPGMLAARAAAASPPVATPEPAK
jgi:hypothetical protein